MADSISRQFARWAAHLTYEDLPPAVVDKVKALVLQHLVAATMGAPMPRAKEIVELVKREEGKADGATIIGDGAKATRNGATIANCEVLHVSGLYDSYRMITHPGPVVIAVALTNAELEHKSVKEMITALAAGYEFECRLANDFVPSTSAHGYRPAPIFSTMGAVMVAAKLMGLHEDGIVAAIAIATSSASGLNEAGRVGGGEQALHEPNAAKQGVWAATMARTGHVKGSETSIEGDAGFYNAYAGSRNGKLSYNFQGPMQTDLAKITAGLGQHYEMLTVMFRMYSTAGFNQPVIDLIKEMREQHHIDRAKIDRVTLFMNYLETLYPSPEFPRVPDPSQAYPGSTQYFAAHAAVHGGYPVVGGRRYGPQSGELLEDRAVLDFMMHHVRLVGVHDQPMFSPEITIRMQDGTTYTGAYPYQRMEWNFDQIVERLQECVPGIPGGQGQLDALVELMRTAETLPSTVRMLELTASK
ncbi:MAG: hypothetical protein EXR64_01280 [Dehalococcoidia bacterium]|nr:hypothetical protein [Dehalococcoidia bacterium]